MKIKIPLKKTSDDSYKIHLRAGLMESLPALLLKDNYGRKYAIVTDSNVKKLYGEKMQKLLAENGIYSVVVPFPAGESNKNLRNVEKICSQLSILGIERSDCLIALGGGVTGDLAGFVAAVYLRGIPYLQIPTSLLAMTDSSIGGKTGVDSNEGKNLIGCFKQPRAVFIDPNFLVSLPASEIRNGMAEVIKHAVIGDKGLFKFLEKKREAILNLEEKPLLKMLKRSIKVKKALVMADEHENGVRVFLNYGHTIGHALESASNYAIPHGQAIAIGMFLINKIAMARGAMNEKNGQRINSLLSQYGLPNRVPQDLKISAILKALKKDKKSRDGVIWYIVPKKIGQVGITRDITSQDLIWALSGKT